MLSLLERIPSDVLQNIALLSAAPDSAAPTDLCALLATCRAVYDNLNAHYNPHLYAAIFKLKYGTPSSARGAHLTDSALGAELRRRCCALRRCRRLDMSRRGLRQDLWTLLWMVLDDAGPCNALSEVGFSKFMVALARYHLSPSDAPRPRPYGDLPRLVLWLLCLGLSQADILSQILPEVRSALVVLLRPFVSSSTSSAAPPVTSPPPSSAMLVNFQPISEEDGACFPTPPSHVVTEAPDPDALAPTEENIMRYNAPLHSTYLPSPSDAAIILIFALKEAVVLQIPPHLPATRAIATAENRTGQTAEDYIAFQTARTPLFAEVRAAATPRATSAAAQDPNPTATLKYRDLDPWAAEILSDGEGSAQQQRACPCPPGALAGIWEGSLMISSCATLEGAASDGSASPDFLCRTPMQVEFSEYQCLAPSDSSVSTNHNEISVDAQMGRWDARILTENSGYRKFTTADEFQARIQRSSAAVATVLIGQTSQDHEEAWGSGGFIFTGRVRHDGVVVFTRRPKHETSDVTEAWVFEGRLRYGTAFVGTFRSSISNEASGVHGIFSLTRRKLGATENSMQQKL